MARYFYGWNVVAGTFVVALFSFGIGFYGVTVCLAGLQRLHGWSASAVSAPVTLYYVVGAALTAWIGDAYARFGPRLVVAVGSIAMAGGVAMLGVVTQPWQLFPVFFVMAFGWGAMSGAALNILVAPWFERRRGLAVSIAFNGATLGGVVIVPALAALIEAVGLARALALAAGALLAGLLPIATIVMRRDPEVFGVGPDGDLAPARRDTAAEPARRGEAMRTWRFWSVSAPFALGLAAQVGLLTHQMSLLAPALGATGAAHAVSITAAAAVIGRLVTGLVVDRLNPRHVASATLVVQMLGLGILAHSLAEHGPANPWTLYGACALFGLGVGNLTTLPGLILAAEWPRARFSALIGLVVGINQCTFAFGPSLVGVVRDLAGRDAPALVACIGLEVLAALLVLTGPAGRRSQGEPCL